MRTFTFSYKFIILITLSLIALIPVGRLHSKPTEHAHAHGVHGMVMFGHDNIYLSHLPLYAHPHDWQIILQVAAKDSKLLAEIKTQLAEKTLLTIEPEMFDLMRLNPTNTKTPLKSFKANIYIGHFERDGKLWKKNIEIQVLQVKAFRQLDPSTTKPTNSEYYVLGDKKHTYLIHRIFGRPDFDQIIHLQSSKSKSEWLTLKTGFSNTPENRIQANQRFHSFLDQRGWKNPHEIYFETGDLQ
jgi:hypothetical protein